MTHAMELTWWCHSQSLVFMKTTDTKSIAIQIISVMMFAEYARFMKHLTKRNELQEEGIKEDLSFHLKHG